ncbi:hypothetical protein LTR09_001067 [Extremus antarcticus]|uniref:Uncharacterized protein n=1 Tax=Extremus antarcticus TaxID=702011 RepID=A0AAJ0GI73_9PEZI|nr:hypothetical protein LTR09_001067 [Extremus antarcticus]
MPARKIGTSIGARKSAPSTSAVMEAARKSVEPQRTTMNHDRTMAQSRKVARMSALSDPQLIEAARVAAHNQAIQEAGPDLLTTIPEEIGEMIANDLKSAADLRCFRLASRTTARLGYKPLRDSVPDAIEYTAHFPFSAARLLDELVVGLQDRLPECAAKVKSLNIKDGRHRSGEVLVTPAIGAIDLPSLQSLELTSVSIPAKLLLRLLRHHRRTLRKLTINDVSLLGHRDMNSAKSYAEWCKVLRYIQKHMRLKGFMTSNLDWHDFDTDRYGCGIHTPNAKYHQKYSKTRPRSHWQFLKGGLYAQGYEEVQEGLEQFLKEIAKPAKP